jgi:hypothetical protein
MLTEPITKDGVCSGKLLEFTGRSDQFQGGLDLVYLAESLENYVALLPAHPVLAQILGTTIYPHRSPIRSLELRIWIYVYKQP